VALFILEILEVFEENKWNETPIAEIRLFEGENNPIPLGLTNLRVESSRTDFRRRFP
jgi:hypothetical protein